MAKIGKLTVFVEQGMTGQVIRVRTTGKRGTVLLNTVTTDTPYPSQSPSDTAPNFWHDVLTKASATF